MLALYDVDWAAEKVGLFLRVWANFVAVYNLTVLLIDCVVHHFPLDNKKPCAAWSDGSLPFNECGWL
jgi:hypothetical protein